MYLNYEIDESAWDVGYKHIYVCNAIFNIAQCLHKVIDQKGWLFIFSALQKISFLIQRVEFEQTSTTPYIFNFHVIQKRVDDNKAKYLPKENVKEQKKIEQVNQELHAGTGGEGESQGVGLSPPTKKPGVGLEEEVKSVEGHHEDLESPFKPPSLPEEAKAGELKAETPEVGKFALTSPESAIAKSIGSPKVKYNVSPEAGLNFYKLNNLVLPKREDSSPVLIKSKDMMNFGKKIPKLSNLHSEVESMKHSMEALFTFTSYFDVSSNFFNQSIIFYQLFRREPCLNLSEDWGISLLVC